MALRRVNTAEAVVNHFKELLESGELHPGDQLPSERELQASLAVSRFSLREGLARLSALGIIRIVHGKGAFVKRKVNAESIESALLPFFVRQSPKQLLDLMEVRAMLDAAAAVKAVENRTPEDIEELRGLIQKQKDVVDSIDAFAERDYRFHEAIVRMTGNELFLLIYKALSKSLIAFLKDNSAERKRRVYAVMAHEDMLKAMEKGDTKSARALVTEHATYLRDRFKKYTEVGRATKKKTGAKPAGARKKRS